MGRQFSTLDCPLGPRRLKGWTRGFVTKGMGLCRHGAPLMLFVDLAICTTAKVLNGCNHNLVRY